MAKYIEGQSFENQNFNILFADYSEFENCTFKKCEGAEVDFSRKVFVDCEFINCNLTGIKLTQTSFKNIQFKSCKLMGLHFFNCNPFLLEFNFEECTLDLSSFYGLKIPKTKILNSRLTDVDFTNTDIKGGSFYGSNMASALFDKSNVELCDFRNVENLNLSPNLNQIKKAIFDRQSAMGLLHALNIVIKD
jgi:fluoroquinolone resistance protein